MDISDEIRVKYKELKDAVGVLDEPNVTFYGQGGSCHFAIVGFGMKEMQAFLDMMKTLQTLGAIRGKDYIICAYAYKGIGVQLVIHSTDKWISTENVTSEYREFWD